MILILSNAGDPHLPLLLRQLDALHEEYFVFRGNRRPSSTYINLATDNDYRNALVGISRHHFSTYSFSSILNRCSNLFSPYANFSQEANEIVVQESDAAFMGALLESQAFWVNHPIAETFAHYKVVQLEVAKKIGFNIPRSLITNEPSVARRFYDECSGRVIIKLLGTRRIFKRKQKYYGMFTTPLLSDDLRDLELIKQVPCLFQEQLPKVSDIRITVVGNDVIAVEILNLMEGTVDYRRDLDNLRLTPIEMSEEIKAKCIALARELGLAYGAIDMVQTSGHELVFLEINPHGAFAWLDELTRNEISKALACLLCHPIPIRSPLVFGDQRCSI